MKTRRLRIINKNRWIVGQVSGKHVLHIGCTDWPLTVSRLQAGELLHSMLCQSAKQCVGVDLDEEGIHALRELMPEQAFYCMNAEVLANEPELVSTRWDLVIAGDVVEHMDNPGLFFKSVYNLLNNDGTLIVTVPSAFSAKRFFWLILTGIEQVHPDHTAYFSEANLARIAERSGFQILEILGFQWINPTVINSISNLLAKPFLWLSGGRCADEIAVIFVKKLH